MRLPSTQTVGWGAEGGSKTDQTLSQEAAPQSTLGPAGAHGEGPRGYSPLCQGRGAGGPTAGCRGCSSPCLCGPLSRRPRAPCRTHRPPGATGRSSERSAWGPDKEIAPHQLRVWADFFPPTGQMGHHRPPLMAEKRGRGQLLQGDLGADRGRGSHAGTAPRHGALPGSMGWGE